MDTPAQYAFVVTENGGKPPKVETFTNHSEASEAFDAGRRAGKASRILLFTSPIPNNSGYPKQEADARAVEAAARAAAEKEKQDAEINAARSRLAAAQAAAEDAKAALADLGAPELPATPPEK